jgi:hypothetical protein
MQCTDETDLTPNLSNSFEISFPTSIVFLAAFK